MTKLRLSFLASLVLTGFVIPAPACAASGAAPSDPPAQSARSTVGQRAFSLAANQGAQETKAKTQVPNNETNPSEPSPSDIEPSKSTKGTLPRIDVSPPPTSGGPSGSPSDDPGQAPNSIDNQSPNDPSDFSNDVLGAYPSLSQQVFGGQSGVLRGEKSLLDSSQFGSIVNRAQLDERQASDMSRALEKEVGVLMQSTARGQASPFVRGLTGQEVLILVDGVRLNNSTFRFGPNQYFTTIDPGQVEQIEVVRGPASVAWGSDAIGGAINVITRSASTDRGNWFSGGSIQEIFSTADMASYTRVNGEAGGGNWDVFAGGSYSAVNNLDRGGDLGRQPFTNFDQHAADVKFNYYLGCDQVLTFAASHFEQNNLPRSDRFAPFVNTPVTNGAVNLERPTFFDPQQRDLAYVRWQGIDDSGWVNAFTVTGSYIRQKEANIETRPELNPDRIEESEFRVDTAGLNFTLLTDMCDAGKLTYGVDLYHDDIDSTRVRTSGAGSGPRNPQFPDDSYYERFGVFLNWDVMPIERLNIGSGVRYENIQTAGTLGVLQGPLSRFERAYSDWIFSVGMNYEINDCLRAVGGVYEGFRAPNLDDLSADNTVQANATDSPSLDVQPEHSLTYEAGFKWESCRWRGQSIYFWNDFEDRIQRARFPNANSANFIRDNFDVYIHGLEFANEFVLNESWSAYGNYWYTFGQDLDRNEPVSRIPPQQGTLGLRWHDDCRQTYFDIYAWIVDRQNRYANENFGDPRFPAGGTPGYQTLNLRAGRTFDTCYGKQKVSLGLENITDKAYRVLGSGVDGPGFNGVLGYEISF